MNTSEKTISVDPFPIPDHYYRINGIDYGIDHPVAGVFLAWDKDADTMYLFLAGAEGRGTPIFCCPGKK